MKTEWFLNAIQMGGRREFKAKCGNSGRQRGLTPKLLRVHDDLHLKILTDLTAQYNHIIVPPYESTEQTSRVIDTKLNVHLSWILDIEKRVPATH